MCRSNEVTSPYNSKTIEMRTQKSLANCQDSSGNGGVSRISSVVYTSHSKPHSSRVYSCLTHTLRI